MNIVPRTVKEAIWNFQRTLDAEADQAKAEALRIADISTYFHFAKDDTNTHFIAPNVPSQLAMTLTEKVSGRVRTVIVKNDGGVWVWLVENMAKCPVDACDLISCVKARIGAKLACQLTGKVVLQ